MLGKLLKLGEVIVILYNIFGAERLGQTCDSIVDLDPFLSYGVAMTGACPSSF
jgi:hypothetical protein